MDFKYVWTVKEVSNAEEGQIAREVTQTEESYSSEADEWDCAQSRWSAEIYLDAEFVREEDGGSNGPDHKIKNELLLEKKALMN